ncbi:MAG: hypothetical protein H7X95_02500, partial [Deltaproteobacteria bacterium]|nr:hypothetical protein [Deltaproteobacteria bacterium]
FKGLSDAPQLTLMADGNVKFGAQDLRTYNPAGKLLSTVVIPGGVKETTSVSPLDGRIVIGGEHHSPTGREPWRCPILNTHKPDGTLQYQLYDWGGQYVGLDNCRQVSDSVVRQVTHDKDGNILFYAWSDGGNSVMTTQPNDVRTGVGMRGLGMSTAGAGALSCVYLVRVEPKDFRVIGWTLWLATAAGKPNSAWVDALGQTDDGTICFAGRTAWGLTQTTNKLADGAPAAEYIAILSPDMSVARFSSSVPGAGVVRVGNKGGWGIASGTVQGKSRVLFLAGAAKESTQYETTTSTATMNAVQPKFGGGWSDGYAVLLELPPLATSGTEAAAVAAKPIRLTVPRQTVDAKKPDAAPASPGGTFYFTPTHPKWVTVDGEFRDVEGKMWPSFVYGKPVSGTCTMVNDVPQASLVVEGIRFCQNRGEQDRRILGELATGTGQKVTFTLSSVGPIQTESSKETDAKGKEVVKEMRFAVGKGTIEIAGKVTPVTPRCVFKLIKARDNTPDGVRVSAFMTVKGKDLGLKAPGAQGDMDIRFSFSGATTAEPPPKIKK